jgi:hypothetical protein
MSSELVEDYDDEREEYDIEEFDFGPEPPENERLDVDERAQDVEEDTEGMGKFADIDWRMTNQSLNEKAPPKGMTARGEHNVSNGVRNQYQSCHTGPKGVKADYAESKFNAEKAQMLRRIREERKLERIQTGDNSLALQQLARSVYAELDARDKIVAAEARDEAEDSELSSDLDSDDDEIFMSYRLKQLALIRNSLPSFGHFHRQSKATFGKIFREEHELVYVVAHLYENHIEECTRLNLVLENVAAQFTHVHFLRVRATDAIDSYDDLNLPTLVVYRGGKLVHSFPRVYKKTGPINDVNIVKFLAQLGVLKPAVAELEQKISADK